MLGRTEFGRFLRTQLARDVAPPAATHRAIVETPYACIVTTNFDTLLEDAFARWSDFGIPKAPTGMELAQHGTLLLDGAFFILKAHGTIHDDESMVFTSEDYRRITHANPAFQAVMSSLLLTHAVLFVGYSLSDPNFRLLMDSQLSTFGSEAPPRYALMENIGETEKAILRRTAGIEVISFAKGAFGEVAGLLRYLARATAAEGSASPPAARPAAHTATRPATDPVATSPQRVLRTNPAVPALVVRLRARDVMVDCTWFETTTRDLDGVRLPGSFVTTLLAPDASYAKVLRELRHGRYDIVHFSGVSRDEEDGSYLILHDGKVGTSELITLLIKRPPALLFLNSLYSGFVPVFSRAFPLTLREGMSFDDHYRALRRRRVGFERAAARSGVGTFVGVMGLTDDDVAGQVARAFYDALIAGKDAAHALYDARQRVRDEMGKAEWGRANRTALQVAIAGYPDLRLVPRATSRRRTSSSVMKPK